MRRLLLVVAIATPAIAHADSYTREVRVARLGNALDALHALGNERGAFELELHTAIRTKCQYAATTRCMIDVARAICAKRPDVLACTAASDVILTNQHAERDLLDERTRVRLVRTSSDYHAAALAELGKRYALLAAELALFQPSSAELPARVDRFCAERDTVAHRCEPGAPACVESLPWQRCAAGLVWYIASHDGAKP